MTKLQLVKEWAQGDSWNMIPHVRDCLFMLMLTTIVTIGVIFLISVSISYTTSDEYVLRHPEPQDVACPDLYDFIMGDRTLYDDIDASWAEIDTVYNAKCKA